MIASTKPLGYYRRLEVEDGFATPHNPRWRIRRLDFPPTEKRMLAALIVATTMFAPQSPSGVVINELSYDDSSTDDYEFVELYNGSTAAVDISGWTLVEEDGSSTSGNVHTIMAGTILQPGAFWVIGDTLVPNKNEDLSYSLENGPDGVYLADTNGVVQDGVAWEVQRWTNVIPTWLEGDGFAGDIQLHEHGGMNQNSISRGIDGLDTDDNGCDFRVAPWTPGTLNLLGMTTNLPYINDFDDPVGSDVSADFTYSFVSGNTVDPAAAGIPASPQGGNVAQWWDPTGGGNANWLKNFTQADYLLESYVYLTGPNANFDMDDGTNWTMGVRGHSDSFGEYQDIGGFHGVVSCTTTQSGHTGIAWVCNTTQLTSDLYLVDFNNGAGNTLGGDFTVLAGPIAIQTGVNDGWQRIRLCVQGTSVVGNFGGTYGADDGQRFAVSTNTVCANGAYLTFRECVTNNLNITPLTTDALFIGDCAVASSSLIGTGSPTSVNTPSITASTAPVIGDPTFAINASGLIPGGAPFAGIILDVGSALPGIPVPGAPSTVLIYTNPSFISLIFANASGDASFGFPLPSNAALMNLSLIAQIFDWDVTMPFALPIGVSPGLVMNLGY
jgi:hypothetical protein